MISPVPGGQDVTVLDIRGGQSIQLINGFDGKVSRHRHDTQDLHLWLGVMQSLSKDVFTKLLLVAGEDGIVVDEDDPQAENHSLSNMK